MSDTLLILSCLKTLTRAYEANGRANTAEHLHYLKQKALIALITKRLN